MSISYVNLSEKGGNPYEVIEVNKAGTKANVREMSPVYGPKGSVRKAITKMTGEVISISKRSNGEWIKVGDHLRNGLKFSFSEKPIFLKVK